MRTNKIHIPSILNEDGTVAKEGIDIPLAPIFNLYELPVRGENAQIESVFRKHQVPYSFNRGVLGPSYSFIVAGAWEDACPIIEELNQFPHTGWLHRVRKANRVEFTRAYAACYMLERPENDNRFCLLHYTHKGYVVIRMTDEEVNAVSRMEKENPQAYSGADGLLQALRDHRNGIPSRA